MFWELDIRLEGACIEISALVEPDGMTDYFNTTFLPFTGKN